MLSEQAEIVLPRMMSTREKGLGIAYVSQALTNVQDDEYRVVIGTRSAPDFLAAKMAPGFTLYAGPLGPSTAKAPSKPESMAPMRAFKPAAPRRLEDPRQTINLRRPRIFDCKVPSRDRDVRTTRERLWGWAKRPSCLPCQKQNTLAFSPSKKGSGPRRRTRHVERSTRKRMDAKNARISRTRRCSLCIFRDYCLRLDPVGTSPLLFFGLPV